MITFCLRVTLAWMEHCIFNSYNLCAMTFSLTTLSITTFSIMNLIVALNIKKHSKMTGSTSINRHYAECHYAEWGVLFIVLLNVIILNVVVYQLKSIEGSSEKVSKVYKLQKGIEWSMQSCFTFCYYKVTETLSYWHRGTHITKFYVTIFWNL